MKEALVYNIRAGKHVNIVEELDKIESRFRSELKTTIDTFDNYDEVSAETFNDELIANAMIRMMEKLGYLDDDEATEICTMIAKIRTETLEEMSGKKG